MMDAPHGGREGVSCKMMSITEDVKNTAEPMAIRLTFLGTRRSVWVRLALC